MAAAKQEQEIVYDNTVEALFGRALGKKLTAKCKERLKNEGLDLGNKLRPFYPREQYYRFVNIAAEELFPGNRDKAHYQLGSAFILGFNETLIGKAVISVVRMIGARRALERMTQNFRSSNNYMQTKLTEVAPNTYELWLSQTSGAPAYFEGVLQTALSPTSVKNLKVERANFDGTAVTLRISWEP
jgi:uncharacterized protein (TIGR02265 family)